MARREPSLTTERFTTSQLLEIDACTRCGECLNWCPVLEEIEEETFTPEGREGMTDKQKMDFSPKNKLTGMREMLNKGYGLRAKLFGPRQIPEDDVLKLKDEIYHCTTCGICSTVCEASINTVEIWESFRRNAVMHKRGPYGKQTGFVDLLASHNVFAADQEDRLCWVPEDIEIKDKADVAYFTGCTAAFRMQRVGVATTRVLQALDIPFTMLGPEEWCCVSVLIRTGQLELAEEFVNHNVNAMIDKGVKTVIYACAGCHRTSRIDWPKFYEGGDLPFEILAISEYMDRLLDDGTLSESDFDWKNPLKKRVTFHDSCHTGRHCGVYDAPRRIYDMVPGAEFVEMARTRELQRCCGAGGGIKAGVSDLALKMAQKRVQDAELVNADIITCTCPFCRRNIMDGINAMDTNIIFKDQQEILAEAMGLDLTLPDNPYIDKQM